MLKEIWRDFQNYQQKQKEEAQKSLVIGGLFIGGFILLTIISKAIGRRV